MRKPAISATLLSTLSATAAIAAPFKYQQAYDAYYEIRTPSSFSTMHQLSDGKGHMRTITEANGQKTTLILDFNTRQAIKILDSQKLYAKGPMTQPQLDAADIGKEVAGRIKLPARTIDGHPCDGFETSKNGGISVVWIGKDIKNLVHSEATTPTGPAVMSLKRYSQGAPGQDLLAIPQGYRQLGAM